jgi:hypothetical protein
LSEDRHEAKRIFCNVCAGDTNHILRARYTRSRVVCEGEQPGKIQTSIWSCAGCDDESFEWLFIPIDDEPSGPTYFPPRSEDSPRDLIQPKPFVNLDPKLRQIYDETVRSFNGGCFVLSNIGLGALLEGICTEKGLTGKNMVDDLKRFLPNPNVIQALIELVDARNDAAHRLDARSQDKLRLAIDFMEDLLNSLYSLDYKALLVRAGSRKAAFDAVKPGRVQ